MSFQQNHHQYLRRPLFPLNLRLERRISLSLSLWDVDLFPNKHTAVPCFSVERRELYIYIYTLFVSSSSWKTRYPRTNNNITVVDEKKIYI